MITIEGKNPQDYIEQEKINPNSTNVIWEWLKCDTIIGLKDMIIGLKVANVDGSNPTGKCWYRGKCYEGDIEYLEDVLYVGGESVK